MQNDLIAEASKLFPSLDHWESFLELANQRDGIRDFWFTEATRKIRRHFRENLHPEWGIEAHGATDRDTRWFLKEFGPGALTLSFTFHYRFDLKLNNHQEFSHPTVAAALMTSEFSPILLAFSRIDMQNSWGSELIELRNFSFEPWGSREFTEYDLAWFAAHRQDSFVAQAIAKVEKFTNDPVVTDALKRLNQVARVGARE